MFSYRDILKRALAIIWRHKNLWFFGLFASLLAGVGRYQMSFSRLPEAWDSTIFSGLSVFVKQGILEGGLLSGLALLFRQDPVAASIFVVFFLIIIVLSLFLLWLAVVSQAGLINNSGKIIKQNGKAGSVAIKEGIEAGVKNFWPVLAYNIIGACLGCLFAVLVGLPLVYITDSSDVSVSVLYFLLFILFIPLALIVSFLVKYAVCFRVLKGKKFVDSIVEAIKLFSKNWIISIEMALILFLVDVAAVLAVGLTISILAIPYLFTALVFSAVFAIELFRPLLSLGGWLAIIFVILAGSVTTAFKITAWTDVFSHLVDKKGSLAKIVRLAEGMKKKKK